MDIDVLTGYNIDGFDYPYLFARAKALKIDEQWCKLLSRDVKIPAKLKKSFFQSAAVGTREDYALVCPGRFSMDTMKFIKTFFKLRSYGLAAVSQHFLKKSKVEMDYKLIPVYQLGTDEQRAHLSYYCYKDAELCIDLLECRKASIMYIQNARVCGVPWKFLIERGQQVLSQSLLARYCRNRDFIMPSSTESQNDEETKGATVKIPLVGFYKIPVITLDFQSLYPSCIMAWNICYSTKVKLSWAKANLKPTDYYIPPIPNVTYCFVADHIHLGILPEVETTLFNHRKVAKGKKAAAEGTPLEVVYDKLQDAFKLRMNSLYGFLKANMLCDKDLMESVTAWGRWMLDRTTEIVENNFPGSKVIYGGKCDIKLIINISHF